MTPPVRITYRRFETFRRLGFFFLPVVYVTMVPCFVLPFLHQTSCLPALFFHYLTSFSFVLRLLHYFFLFFFSNHVILNQTTSSICMSNRFIFLPDFHALLSFTKQLTLFYSTDFSLIQFCLFISGSFLLLKRTDLHEIETYSHVNASQHEINEPLSQESHKTVQQIQV